MNIGKSGYPLPSPGLTLEQLLEIVQVVEDLSGVNVSWTTVRDECANKGVKRNFVTPSTRDFLVSLCLLQGNDPISITEQGKAVVGARKNEDQSALAQALSAALTASTIWGVLMQARSEQELVPELSIATNKEPTDPSLDVIKDLFRRIHTSTNGTKPTNSPIASAVAPTPNPPVVSHTTPPRKAADDDGDDLIANRQASKGESTPPTGGFGGGFMRQKEGLVTKELTLVPPSTPPTNAPSPIVESTVGSSAPRPTTPPVTDNQSTSIRVETGASGVVIHLDINIDMDKLESAGADLGRQHGQYLAELFRELAKKENSGDNPQE
jgi:hypothetical protein